jgi:hypothetical protein
MYRTLHTIRATEVRDRRKVEEIIACGGNWKVHMDIRMMSDGRSIAKFVEKIKR